MGKYAKPQKSKKNKKIKAIDPFYVGDRLADRNAPKYDQKPKAGDEQEFSRGVWELMKLKEEAKVTKKRKRHRKNLDGVNFNEHLSGMERGVTRPYKPEPDFKRRKGEREPAFMRRVDREVQAVIQKSQFEDKYEVDTDDLERNAKNPGGKVPKAAPSLKNKRRLAALKERTKAKKKNKRENRLGGFERLKDEVKFGEVAKEPPKTSFKPKKLNKSLPTLQPSLIKEIAASRTLQTVTCDPGSMTSTRELGQSVRRKNMSVADRRAMDLERQRVIDLYRQRKNAQQAASSSP